MTLRATTFLCLAILTLPAAARAAASSQDPDWPCIQRLVPRIVAAQVWAGPEPDAAAWNDDREIARLGARLAARRTPIEETEKLVEAFAEAQPKQALNAKLTALFGRTLEVINRDRASIIAGIKRFSVRQRELAERIREARATVEQNAGAAAANDDLTEQLNWSIRIFDEREKSMTYLCEQPVLLEQRAFALGRTIYFFVED
ncbi:MAG TPA: hypothetical protein VIS03_19955 [Kiloniellaceae bacterium]